MGWGGREGGAEHIHMYIYIYKVIYISMSLRQLGLSPEDSSTTSPCFQHVGSLDGDSGR